MDTTIYELSGQREKIYRLAFVFCYSGLEYWQPVWPAPGF